MRLSAALTRLDAHQFAVNLIPATRAYFEAQSRLVPPDVAADMRAVLGDPHDAVALGRLWTANPAWNALLRTTCVVTEISGGHAPNALPQNAHASVNRRILPVLDPVRHSHGLNERIRVKSLLDGRRFLYEVVKLYANDAPAPGPAVR
ncbi:MAG: peptidase dimerization domain-containing protein [Steroidobacterales bacterium]